MVLKSVTAAMPMYSTVYNPKRCEGKYLRKSDTDVMKFMRCERGGGVVYILPRMLAYNWTAPG